MHFDLTSSSLADQQHTVARSLRLGARHIDIGQRPEEGHVLLADPDGHEFCVLTPR
jgi:Glyoxalase-like domain